MAPDSRERIETAAAEILARDGYNAMGVKALSEAAGLPYGSIYHHFPGGKEEIAVAAIARMEAALVELMSSLFVGGVNRPSIRALFDFMADRLEQTGWRDACPVGTPALDGSSRSEAVREACARAFDSLVAVLSDALVRQGRRRAAADSLASAVLSMYEGATLVARAQGSRAPLDHARDAAVRLVDADGPKRSR